MLGPSFSPSIARIPGPTSSHSRYAALAVSARVMNTGTILRACGVLLGQRGRDKEVVGAASLEAIDRLLQRVRVVLVRRWVDFHAHRAGELSADRVFALCEHDEQRAAEGARAHAR